MKLIRRDVLKFAGGTAAGLLFTPVPWKLLDDVSIWTQNWPWTPTPPRGPWQVKYTTCTMCQAGCPVEARCVGETPVILTGAAGGSLCPAGICAHHLRFAPRPPSVDLDDVVRRASEALNLDGEGLAAVLDLRPGRTVSLVYRSMAQRWRGGAYLTTPLTEGATAAAVGRITGHPVGLDLDNTKTLLSFSTPVLDGWGTPGRVMRRHADGLRVIQVESRNSVTASLADEWIAIHPGAEGELARILSDSLTGRPVGDDRIKNLGLKPATIRALLETLGASGPAVAIGDGDHGSGPLSREAREAIAELNFVLGSVGAPGGFVARREAPAPVDWSTAVEARELGDVPDGSIRWLFIDESGTDSSIPWSAVQRKLRSGAYVIAASSCPQGLGRQSSQMVPAAALMETFDDAPVAVDSTVATFRVSVPMCEPKEGSVAPLELLGRITGVECTVEAELERRAAAIQAGRRGRILNYSSGESSELPAESLWNALAAGACWQDDAPAVQTALRSKPHPTREPEGTLPESRTSESEFPLLLAAIGWRGADNSPLMRKLDQESDLRQARHVARLHPETAARFGVADGMDARVETQCGSGRMRIKTDASMPPGTIEVAAGQQNLDLCDTDGNCSWRAARARIRTA
jgi:menaquinone reductase, molybdopterin-binding-like subunit